MRFEIAGQLVFLTYISLRMIMTMVMRKGSRLVWSYYVTYFDTAASYYVTLLFWFWILNGCITNDMLLCICYGRINLIWMYVECGGTCSIMYSIFNFGSFLLWRYIYVYLQVMFWMLAYWLNKMQDLKEKKCRIIKKN
jgi:hypothetical protein